MKTTKKRKNYYLPEETINQIKALAEKWNTSENGAIEEAIKAAILTKWRPAKQTTSEKAGALIYGTEAAESQPEQETPKAEAIEEETPSREDLEKAMKEAFPDNSEETEEKPKITIFRNVAARPRRRKAEAESLDDEENRKTEAGAVPSADKQSNHEEPEAYSPEEHTEMAIRLRRGEITPDEFRDYVERKHYREKKARQAEKKEKERQEAEAKAAKAAERKAKAEAKRQKEEAEKAAAEENARIDRAIEKAKAKAEAGKITADELKAEIDRLNDERPF